MKQSFARLCLFASLVAAHGCTDTADQTGTPVGVQQQRLVMASGWVSGSGWPSDTVVVLNSLHLRPDSHVIGNMAVIRANPGPYLAGSSEAVLNTSVELKGNLRSDSVDLRDGAHVMGNVAYNTLVSTGTIDGTKTTPLALPLSVTVPTVPNFTAGTTNVSLASSARQTLAAGSYKDVTLRAGTSSSMTVLTLSGGVYALQSLSLADMTRVECSVACEVRIKGRVLTGSHSYIGPSATSALQMSAVQLFVEGTNGGSTPSSTPFAAEFGANSELKGFVFVPNGTLQLRSNSNSIGKFLAKDLEAGNDADLRDGTGIVVLPGAWVSGQRWPSPVITALNSFDFNTSAKITGDVAVITAATGPTLSMSYEASLASNVLVTGNLSADSAIIRSGARVTGSVSYNNLTNNGTVGSSASPLALPLDISAPAFPAFTAGTLAVDLAATTDRTLAAGSYGLIKLRAGTAADHTVLTLSGGTYNIADIDLADYANIECAAACELHIKNRIAPGTNDFFGPKAGSGLDVSDVRIFVEGKNSGDGAPGTTPYAAVFGQTCTLSAFVFVPNGTLQVRTSAVVKGRLVARDVAVADSAKVDAAGSVITAPQIITNPANASVLDGQSATFSVVAIGSAITFQWQRGGVNIPGATAGSYTLAPATIADNGASFRVVVSNAAGSVTSSAALLTVNPVAPLITTQPASVTATEGQSASFTCAASGTSPSYQWKKAGQNVSGATAATFTIASVAIGDAASYTCVASNAAGSATSNPATLTVQLRAPTITTQPSDLQVTEGQTANFSLVATGTDRSYQWRNGGHDIAGATAATLSLPNVPYTAAGSYDCVVSNAGGAVTSTSATLTVLLRAPTITQNPMPLSVIQGASATFTCAADGNLVSYQWQKNGVDILGAAGTSYTIAAAQLGDIGSYRCVASNSGGSANSNAAALAVTLAAPVITQQPVSLNLTEKQTATFSCSASGTSLSFQWQKGAQNIAGATLSTYSIASVSKDDAGDYRCVASNTGGSAVSQVATLTVALLPPVITSDPSALTVRELDAASFSCAASGTLVQFRWQKDGADIAGAGLATYTIAHAQIDDAGAYRCVASNSAGSVASNAATLTVQRVAPVITAQPTARTVTEHQATTFSCAASGTAVSFHWQKGGQDIAGSNDSSFSIASVEVGDAGNYACVATNSGGTATSNAAALTVALIAPVITLQPQPVHVTEKQSATFSCSASGTSVSFRWQIDGHDIVGATDSSFSLASAQNTDAGDYRCIATNSGGSASSQVAALTVQLLPPLIDSGPNSLTVIEHEAASFSCTATGTLINYQWQKDGVVIAGAQDRTFSIAHSAQSDEGAYRCVVTNSAGSVTSDPATLNVQALPPVITQQPSARTVTEHASVSFSCAASGIPVSYRWQKNGEDIAGSASATFSIDDVKYTDAGDYACVASNESGSVTSQSAALTVRLVAPVITEQPTALSVTEHAAVSFTCSASGTLVDYHWQKNGADISGATGATFSLASVAYTDAGDYRCVAQNTGGSATSQPATLSVQLLPPTVAAGPLDTRLFEHQTASFHCLGEGTLLSYQWQKDLVDVPGASAQDLTLVGVSPLDAGSYRCAIQNSGGSVFTQAATLTVDLLPPSFPTQPASVTVTEGEPFSLQCTASGTALSFQWAKDDAPLAGANTAAYTVAAAQASDAASYTCTATNSGGSVTSAPVPVVVLLKLPVITGQPSDVTVNPDEPFAFTVSAQGTQLSYQWLRAGGAIPGATSSTYSKAQASVSDDGAEYRVVVSNSAGSVPSRDAIVHISDSAGPTLSLNGATQVSVTTDTFTLSGSAVDVGSGVHDILVRNDRLPGQDFGVVIDSAGAFTGDVPLSLGTNVVTVIARDAHGNETQQTITVVVTATELPQITIIEPSNGSTVQTDSITVRGSVRSTLAASAIKLQLGNDTQFPTGAGPDYAFRFDHVRLVPGPNLISVVAQTTRGTVHGDVTVSYGAITPPPNNPVPPVITLQVGTPEVYLVTDTIPVAGSVLAQRCVQAITVNGTPTSFSGSGQTVSFSTALSFAAAGVNDLTVQVRATDCDGASSSTGFIAHRDDGAPVISIDGLQLSPAVNQLTQTPYRLSGTVTDRSLAGLTVASQSVVAVPTGGAGVWTFSIDVPLQRQLDTPIVIEAWDAAGQRSTSEVVLRLNTSLNLEVLTPRTGTQYIVSGDPVRLEVTARALGMATTDVVLARFDSEPELALARSGDSANSVLTVAPTPGAHTLSVHVQSAEGLNLAQTSISLEFIDQASIPLQVVSQEPAADSSNIEANTPITLHFNRPIEPSKLTMSVLETAHGKLFSDPPPAADMTQLSGVGLVDVNRERESVPGAAQNFPENRMVSFYPSRDYAYGGTVFVELRYDGADLWHTKFAVRPLPTLIHGFVANHTLIPLQGIEVSLPELGRSATTNDDGNWNFGFGDTPEQRIPPGRYRAIANPGRKNQRFGSIERFIEIGAGLGYAGTILIPELNNAEPFRHIASAQVTPAVLAGGDVQLDLTHATLTFPGGLPEGDVHVQFLSASQLGHVSLNGARPDWAFATQPAGVMVDGAASVSIQLPMLDQSYGYVDRLPDRMVLVGLDTRSLQIVPVGVVELDRSAHRLRSVGDMHLQRLDYLGISSVAGSAELLNSYVTHAIGLAELLAGVEAQ